MEEELAQPLAEADGYAPNEVSDNKNEVLPWYRKYCSKMCWGAVLLCVVIATGIVSGAYFGMTSFIKAHPFPKRNCTCYT
jgi:hypothetical protein